MMTSRRAAARLLASAEFARAFTLATVGAVFAAPMITRMSDLVVVAAIFVSLCVFGAAILFVRRSELSWLRMAPTSLVAFLAWTLLSVVWSIAPGASFVHWFALLMLAFLAITIGHIRDTLQTVRSVADVLRVVLAVSLILEIVAGVLLDMPFRFLGIQGNLADGGPIQGVFGTRNLLGFVAMIALITFVVELLARASSPVKPVVGIVLAVFSAVFSASPTVLVLALTVLISGVALWAVRATPQRWRTPVQWMLAAIVAVTLATALLLRHQIIAALGAGSDFSMRADLWNKTLDFIAVRPFQGWGWFGVWDTDVLPFRAINYFLGESHQSALNSYFDVLLQVGVPGLVLFLILGGIAVVRSWLVASARRSIVYAWTPMVLVALAVSSMFESFTIIGIGWFLLTLCALRAGQSHSWREDLDAAQTGVIPTLPDR